MEQENRVDEKDIKVEKQRDINLNNIVTITKECGNDITKRQSFAEELETDKNSIILFHDLLKSAYETILLNKTFDQLDESDKSLVLAYLNFFGEKGLFTMKDASFVKKLHSYATSFVLEKDTFDLISKDYLLIKILSSLGEESM